MPLIIINESRANVLGLNWGDTFDLTSGGISIVKSSELALFMGNRA